MAAIGSISEYNTGDDFTVYEERLSQYCKANKVEDNLKVAILISLIGTEAYKTLRDLCFPVEPKSKSYEDLCNLLKKQFSPTINVFRERITFYKAHQNSHESCNEWYARLKRLAVNCKFSSLEDTLRDKFVTGMTPGPLLDRLVEEPHTKTLEQLVEIAVARESSITSSSSYATNNGVFYTQNAGGSRNRNPNTDHKPHHFSRSSLF